MSAPITFTDPVPQFDPGGAVPPGYQVPRQTNQGLQNVTPEPFFTGPPVDMVPQVIRREDFPPGPEGDQMYAQALQTLMNQPAQIVVGFDETGNPIYGAPITGNVLPTGQTGSEAAAANFQRAAERANSGRTGSDSLAVISRAQVRPQEAQMALFGSQAAMAGGGQGRPDLLLDDATIRNIVTGLGGRGAATDIAQQVRQDLINQGIIPGAFEARGGAVSPEQAAAMQPGGGLPPGARFIGPAPATDPRAPVDHSDAGRTAVTQNPPITTHPTAVTENPPPVTTYPTPVTENPDPYQYTQVGADVFLDVTNPVTGSQHRFTGDVVEAAYSMLGYSSFDEMVLDRGYSSAVAVLFNFIAPPAIPLSPGNAPPGAPPIIPAGQLPGPLGPGQVPPPPPPNPNHGTVGGPGGLGETFF